ncbi:tape measure protein [Nisaea sediminum]|uniref:tape measure protein n=1 Tax=Nisaea sediminum TaxID=2775867 RepID=UPI001866D9E0|nr:tape measure protein [Nisaea sediminum]
MNLETNRIVHEVVIDDRGAVRGAQGVESALDKAAAATARLDKAAGDAGGKLQAVGSAAVSAAKGVGSAATATLDAAAGVAAFASETLTAERAWTALELSVATATGGIGGLKREIAETVVETKLFREEATEAAKAWSTLKRAAAGIGIGLSIGGLISEAQEYTRAQNLLAQSVEGSSALIERSVYGIAQASGQAFTELAGLTKALDELPGGQRKRLDVVEGVALSLAKIPGAAQSSSAAVTQFTQAMQSGVFRGDEFNSVMEQAPPLADALAKGLGVARGALRAMAEEGKLTTERVSEALSSMLPELRRFNQESARAFSQWVQIVDNAFGRFSANVDQRAGASAKLGESLGGVAERLESIQAQNAAVAVLEKLSSIAGIAADAVFLMADNLDLLVGAWVAWQALKAVTGMGLFASSVRTASTAIATLEDISGRSIPKVAKGLTSLGTAAAFSVSPITILLTAVQAVGVGLLLYQSRVTDAQRASELQAQTMDLVADGMAKARRETDSTAKAMAALAKASATEAMVRAQENLAAQAEELRDRVDAVSHSLFVMTNNRVPELANMRSGVKEIMAEFAAGRIDVDGVGEALANLVATNENWRSKAGNSFEAISGWREQNEVVAKANALIAVLAGTATDAEIALLGLGDSAGRTSGSVNKFVTDLRAEASLVGKVGLAREIAINLRKAETTATTELGREVIKLTAALAGEENLRTLRGQNDRLALAKAELDLIGEGEAARAKEMAVLQKQLDLKERGIDLTSTQALEELRLAKAIADVNEKTSNARATQGLERRAALAKAELDLVGEGEAVRDKALATLQKQLDLKERGVDLTSAQAAEEIRLAQSIAETTAATSNANKLQGLRENLQLMKSEIQLADQGAAIREAGVAVLQKQLELRRRGIDLTSEQAREELRLVEAIAEASAQINNVQALLGLRESLKIAEAELALVGETASIRDSQLEILKKELDLKRRGVDLTSEQAREELQLTERIQATRVQLERQRDDLGAIRGIFTDLSSAVSDFATGIAQGTTNMRDLGNVGEAVLAKLIQRFSELAFLNPAQNMLFGDTLPTISSVLSTGSSILGGGGGIGGGGVGGLSNLSGAGSFFGNLTNTGSLTSSFVLGPTGQSLGLSQAIPGAANGAIASGSGIAPTALGSGILQAGSLAVAPFLGMGVAALASLFMKKDLPRSAAQLGAENGLFGVTGVDVGNGGDPAVGQAIGDAAAGIANAFLQVSGLRLGADASLGMIGLDQRVFRSTTSSGAYSDAPDVLGIAGLPRDGRSFDKTVGGQRAASADFAVRNLLKQVLEGTLDGLTETTADTLKLGLGNLARNIESSMTEGEAETFARRLEVLAGWDSLREQMEGLDAVAGDTARRLEKAAKSQELFNNQISALRDEANKAVAESGSGLKGIGDFIDDARALFDPTGGNRFQLRYQLALGGGSDSIDGNANVYTDPGENGRGRTLQDIFSFGANDRSSGVNPNQIVVFDELIETIDQNLGDNGKLIEAFHKAGDNLDFNISKLADILEERGVELQPILDDFFNTEVARERLNEAADMARFKVDQFFETLVGAGDAISGPRQLFEDIVPAVSPIVEQFENLKAQIEATRPDIEALNEDLAAMGEAVIDVDGKISQATGKAAEQAQNQFLAGLGIAVGADGTIRQASVDFDAINSLAQTIKGLDENARVIFENDPRGLSGQVATKINEILQAGITQILSGAEDEATTLEQLEIAFGERIAGFDLAIGDATDAVQEISEEMRQAQSLMATAVSALDSEIASRTSLISSLRAQVAQISQARFGYATNAQTSPFSTLEQLNRAEAQFDKQLAAALAGDEQAQSTLLSTSQSFLEASKTFYGSTTDHFDNFQKVDQGLAQLETSFRSEIEVQVSQLSVLEQIRDELAERTGVTETNLTPVTYARGSDGQYIATSSGVVQAGYSLGGNPSQNLQILLLLAAAGLPLPSGFGSGQLNALRAGNSNVDAFLSANGFAMGGIMTPHGPLALNTYDNGGIANSPQLALFGEGRTPEAYVPLPDGRSIPVSMSFSGAANDGVWAELKAVRLELASMRSEAMNFGAPANDGYLIELRAMRQEIVALRSENAEFRRTVAALGNEAASQRAESNKILGNIETGGRQQKAATR